ncbi:hypothetical protein RSOLAG1IB_10905 [Rhizoctonia solani AG-1 IB]|uniref:Uncharacterized protein n=1 Tax=Thanatephorus cucumeris (strain AG1-IB / isolate 7/3/14) TaxID=1108050 RepID=A0A0B7G5B2_THACB|nr:hypothetical protein RSOLAG1IB_10905 [Rhizoctonia solani AG-1 IB]
MPLRIPARRRATVPSTFPDAPQPRHSMKKFRKFYMSNISSHTSTLQSQNIISASYHQSQDTILIRLVTSPIQGGNLDTLLLESPKSNKGPGMPRLIRSISQSNAMKAIGFMIPIAPNLGHFGQTNHTDADTYIRTWGFTTQDTVPFPTPLPFDNLVVLASKISSRRSRRSLDSPPKTWFIEAMWEGLKRIRDMNDNNQPEAGHHKGAQGAENIRNIPALVDGVMDTFGESLLQFHYKIMKIQQKSDHGATAVEQRKNTVQQEIVERNRETNNTQASWQEAEQRREMLRRRESALRKQLANPASQ